ncbi:signal peptidase II [uncultured Gordonia sp.]|uniref:signal peptidase II n=1 Tax=Gordonia sp. (in: high G+C Gram-positive bacteria) TaxID=84139 RepID=UPI000FA2303C|nr:signal peptidase II [uncultured Gordonia sp.]RUP36327.1 MAG: signal peptidase II [Gordonia sp. (in: high G+C Gram-positive bacteria)]HNP57786.1 signal peptidase II [Gordonia sp. (in: high G+C Gram-positive bacteria)]
MRGVDRAPAARRRVTAVIAVVILAALDLGLKAWAERRLTTDHTIELPAIGLRLAHNPGIAFGFGHTLPTVVLLAGIGTIIAGMTVLTWRATAPECSLAWPPLAAMLAGAIANFADRAGDGVVTDYLHTGWWPTFNLADTYITCGAIALAALTLRPARTGTNSHSETKYDAR